MLNLSKFVVWMLILLAVQSSYAIEEMTENYLTGEVKRITLDQLEELGLCVTSSDTGEGSTLIEFRKSAEFDRLFRKGQIDVTLSIVSADGEVIASIYSSGFRNKISIVHAYHLRIGVSSKEYLPKFKAGVLFLVDVKY